LALFAWVARFLQVADRDGREYLNPFFFVPCGPSSRVALGWGREPRRTKSRETG